MTTIRRCPCCGMVLDAGERASEPAPAPAGGGWEALRGRVGPPRSVREVLDAAAVPGPTWWLPSLAFLAYQLTDRSDARAALDELATRRDQLRYAVVEERTDAVIGLTLQPWPLLDEAGRLRFPIGSDPLQVDVGAPELIDLVRAGRRRWHEFGLLPAELVERPIQIGDVYAVAVGAAGGGEAPPAIGGLAASAAEGWAGVPVVDITWDAREAGKLAHYAAAAGVVPVEAPAADAAVARETEARYMIALRDGIAPRDVRLDPGSTA